MKSVTYTLMIIASLISSSWAQNSDEPIRSIDDAVAVSRIYRDSRLFEQAKEVLIESFSRNPNGPGMDRIYYELGVILFLEGQLQAAIAQWGQLADWYPDSPYVITVSEILKEVSLRLDLRASDTFSDILFQEQLQFSIKLWNFTGIDQKTDWSDIENPWRAYQFYDQMLQRYQDEDKRLHVLYVKFLLVSGHNQDDFGYRHADSLNDSHKAFYTAKTGEELDPGSRSTSFMNDSKPREVAESKLKSRLMADCERLLQEMEELDPGSWQVVDAYFRMGVITSGSSFWSGDLKVNEVSYRYFEKVLALLPPTSLSYRRVFAAFWLSEYDERRVQD